MIKSLSLLSESPYLEQRKYQDSLKKDVSYTKNSLFSKGIKYILQRKLNYFS